MVERHLPSHEFVSHSSSSCEPQPLPVGASGQEQVNCISRGEEEGRRTTKRRRPIIFVITYFVLVVLLSVICLLCLIFWPILAIFFIDFCGKKSLQKIMIGE